MAGNVTLSALRTRIRQRSDQEHTASSFVTDAEINGLINTSYAELYGNLVRSGIQSSETTYSVPVDGSESYALPADFYAMLGVFQVVNGHSIRLRRHDVRHRPNSTDRGDALTYRLSGMTVILNPRPTSGTYEIVYVPIPGTLTADDDELDGVLGWEEYVVLDCAIKILDKEESESRHLRAERERLLARIQDEAAAVEMTETWTVAITRPYTDLEASIDPSSEYTRRGFRG